MLSSWTATWCRICNASGSGVACGGVACGGAAV